MSDNFSNSQNVRKTVIATRGGVVAAQHRLAAEAGAAVLENGGDAIDAAVAMNAMMGLVAPMNDGIGGDLFAIIYEAKSGKLYGLNASGWAPKGLTVEHLRAKGRTDMPGRGIDAATVPGAVNGWEKLLTRFGKQRFADVLAPSIAYADAGFPVGEVVSVYWKDSEKVLREDAATTHTFLPGGRLPQAGELFRNPELAQTYRQIAAGGAAAFYKGAVAAKLLSSSKTHGGTMTAADLAEFDSEWVEPISTTYRGWTVYELPPNGQGIVALIALGTVVIDLATGKPVAEIVEDGQRVVICRGGNGGWGNTHFKTSTHRAPKRANPGLDGQRGEYRLILKSIADVGLVGFPNAGKSSLTTRITKARPKTAAYPFTTLHPQIGVIDYSDEVKGTKRLLLADVPGLIEGAHENRGLGHRFLRHIERCALLIFLIDMAGTDARDPRNDYKHLLNELKLYDPKLLKKPRLVVANKMDVPAAAAELKKFKTRYKTAETIEISCLTGDGLEKLKKELLKRVAKFRAGEKVAAAAAG